MKNLYFSLFLLISFFGFGQCPTSDITLNSQSDVDAFTTNYPSCTDLDYRLTISGDDITDLTPLSTLNSIKGLTVRDNLQLVSLEGLNLSEINYEITQLLIENNLVLFDISALASATFDIDPFDNSSGELRIKDNPILRSLDGLGGLPEFVYSIYIQNNTSLEDLTGLNTVKFSEDLIIENNFGLVSFSGFSSTHETGVFTFVNNNSMTSLSSLGSITPLCGLEIRDNSLLEDIDAGFIYPGDEVCGTSIDISNNQSLMTCSSDYLCSVLALISDATINNNAPGCNTTEEVEAQCSDCPTESLILSSQALVNAFATIYPDCTELDFDLIISGNDITDLTPLSGITSLHSLSIKDNLVLTSLSGLELVINLDGYDDNNFEFLEISNNPQLQSISALSNMTSNSLIEGFVIRNNAQLTSLNGLQGFNEVYAVIIDNNDLLIDLVGLENVTDTDDFLISNNDNLINLNGLNSYSFGDIQIENNISLQNVVGLTSSFQGLLELTGNPSLQSLQGLEQASSIYGITLDGNNVLSDISAINTFTTGSGFGFPFVIKNNPILSTCSIDAVCSLLTLCNSNDCSEFIIENNAPGCNSIPEVAFECGLAPSNDNCETAIVMENAQSVQAYNTFGTQSSQVPSCNDSENRVDVWFTFNSGDNTLFDILVEGGSYNLQLWEGNCTNLAQVSNACASNILESVEVNANTDYYLQVWSDISNDRSSTFFDITIYGVTLSIDDVVESNFSIYPNPVKNVLEFKSDKIINTLEVYNLLGQNVMRTFPNQSSGDLDLSSLSSGIYIIKIDNSDTVYKSYRIIKE